LAKGEGTLVEMEVEIELFMAGGWGWFAKMQGLYLPFEEGKRVILKGGRRAVAMLRGGGTWSSSIVRRGAMLRFAFQF
jgi:hypothetical protein